MWDTRALTPRMFCKLGMLHIVALKMRRSVMLKQLDSFFEFPPFLFLFFFGIPSPILGMDVFQIANVSNFTIRKIF